MTQSLADKSIPSAQLVNLLIASSHPPRQATPKCPCGQKKGHIRLNVWDTLIYAITYEKKLACPTKVLSKMCLSKESPMKTVRNLKHVTKKSRKQTSVRMKRFKHLVAPYCATPRDYLSDSPPSLRGMGFLASQQGKSGAIPPPPFLSVSPLESMR